MYHLSIADHSIARFHFTFQSFHIHGVSSYTLHNNHTYPPHTKPTPEAETPTIEMGSESEKETMINALPDTTITSTTPLSSNSSQQPTNTTRPPGGVDTQMSDDEDASDNEEQKNKKKMGKKKKSEDSPLARLSAPHH